MHIRDVIVVIVLFGETYCVSSNVYIDHIIIYVMRYGIRIYGIQWHTYIRYTLHVALAGYLLRERVGRGRPRAIAAAASLCAAAASSSAAKQPRCLSFPSKRMLAVHLQFAVCNDTPLCFDVGLPGCERAGSEPPPPCATAATACR
jgi:hypothetical protein